HIFRCTWLPTGDPWYIASPGYTLDDKLTTKLTLSVKQLNSRFEGRYTCQIVPSSPGDAGECFLEFGEDGEADANVTTIAVSIAVTVIALVVIAAVVVCFIRKRSSTGR
ncbi:hypothetical protein BaRGS_00039690, partial [Batillaria attramentaria]